MCFQNQLPFKTLLVMETVYVCVCKSENKIYASTNAVPLILMTIGENPLNDKHRK